MSAHDPRWGERGQDRHGLPVPPPATGWARSPEAPAAGPGGAPGTAPSDGGVGRPRRGPLPLRPMNLAELLDGAVKLFLANWRTVLIVAGLFIVPLQLLSAFLQRDLIATGWAGLLTEPEALQTLAAGGPGADLAALLGGLTTVFVLPFVAGAVSKVVAASYLGERLDAGPALRATARRWASLVGAWVLVHLLQAAPYLLGTLTLLFGVAFGGAGMVLLGGLLLLGAVVVHLAIMAAFVAVSPAVVVEELGAVAAMRRSARLLRPRLLPVLGAALLAGLLASILSGVIGGIPSAFGLLAGADAAWALVALGSILGGLVSTPLVAMVATLVYFDARIRQEGLDLRVMAAELGADGVR